MKDIDQPNRGRKAKPQAVTIIQLPATDPDRSLSLVQWLVVVWLAMLCLGYAALRIPGALSAANLVSFHRAIFTSANTSTLTGFAQSFASPGDFTISVQIVFLMQLLSGALLTLIGGGILLARVLGLPHSDSRIATIGLVMIIAAGAAGLATIGPGESLISGFCRGIGALCGSGLSFGAPRASNDLLLIFAFLPMSIVGSLGTLVISDLYDSLVKHTPIAGHALRAMTTSSGLLIVGTLVLLLLTGSILRSAPLAIAASGYGYTTETISQLPRGIDWLLMAIMIVGVGTAGTGGWGIAWLYTLPASFISRVVGACVLQGAMIVACVIALSQTEPQLAAERILMLCVGSATNVGISHTPVAITGNGLLILSALMIAGRLLPVIVLTEIIKSTRAQVLVTRS